MNQSFEMNSLPWAAWMESAANLWLSAAKSWQGLSTSLAGCSRTEECVQASFSLWQSLFAPWTGEGISETKQSQSPSIDMIQALLNVLGNGGLSQELSKWMLDSGQITGRSFEDLRQEAVRVWSGVYEKAVQPLFNIPQIGINRVYQEKINRLADKFASYQVAISEFQMLLSVPMEKSLADMKEEIRKLREKGEPVDDFKNHYGIWIKILENHYMLLFRSDEYRIGLAKLLDETVSFRLTGNEVLTELLEFLPIPTNQEMDELYKELYILKKQTKEASKRIGKIESALKK